jgi:hypothetical protein
MPLVHTRLALVEDHPQGFAYFCGAASVIEDGSARYKLDELCIAGREGLDIVVQMKIDEASRVCSYLTGSPSLIELGR